MNEKRRKEQLRKQKQQDKEQRKARRLAEKKTNPGGLEADLEGIVAGPQPGQIIDLDEEMPDPQVARPGE
ncbi:MAG: hypothetical protein WA740_16145 [Candidatus Binataceae bacterium]